VKSTGTMTLTLRRRSGCRSGWRINWIFEVMLWESCFCLAEGTRRLVCGILFVIFDRICNFNEV
jgi:hypothetical protein